VGKNQAINDRGGRLDVFPEKFGIAWCV